MADELTHDLAACLACEALNRPTHVFCAGCGAPLLPAAKAAPRQPMVGDPALIAELRRCLWLMQWVRVAYVMIAAVALFVTTRLGTSGGEVAAAVACFGVVVFAAVGVWRMMRHPVFWSVLLASTASAGLVPAVVRAFGSMPWFLLTVSASVVVGLLWRTVSGALKLRRVLDAHRGFDVVALIRGGARAESSGGHCLCTTRVPRAAEFCGCCGRATLRRRQALRRSRWQTLFRIEQGARGIVAVYGGVLAMLVVLAVIPAPWGGGLVHGVLDDAALVAAGVLAVLLGRARWRATVASRPRVRHLAVGVAVGGVMFAKSLLLVWLFGRGWHGVGLALPAGLLVVDIAVLPALVEEWLCRGVLWEACRRASAKGTTVVVTALLFALLHLPGGSIEKFPTHLLSGLALGWLRAYSGSLGPSVVAHFLHNFLVLAWAEHLGWLSRDWSRS